MTNVEIHQITPKVHAEGKPNPFINVDQEYYSVQVWTSIWRHPTYLLRSDTNVSLIQFQDQDIADEWLRGNSAFWDEVTKLEYVSYHKEEEDADAEAYI